MERQTGSRGRQPGTRRPQNAAPTAEPAPDADLSPNSFGTPPGSAGPIQRLAGRGSGQFGRDEILRLQRTRGNQAVLQLLRASGALPAPPPISSAGRGEPSPGEAADAASERPDPTAVDAAPVEEVSAADSPLVLQRAAVHVVPGSGATAPSVQRATGVAVQRDDESERDEWHLAQNIRANMPIGAGHITGSLADKHIATPLYGAWKDKAAALKRHKGAKEKAKLIEKNQYGTGKLGEAMGYIDTVSRIIHLIGGIAGLIAFICGIVGFFQPAALPVGAIAGAIAMACHGVMAILQAILVGHNARRMAKLPPEEAALVKPALIRDIVKLVFALIGVGLGGMGLGLDLAQQGGLMASQALMGAEQTAKIGEFVGEQGGEAVATGGLFWGILGANQKEINLGMEGKLDRYKSGASVQGGNGAPTPRPLTRSPRGTRSLDGSSGLSSSGASSLQISQPPSGVDPLTSSQPSPQSSSDISSPKVSLGDSGSHVSTPPTSVPSIPPTTPSPTPSSTPTTTTPVPMSQVVAEVQEDANQIKIEIQQDKTDTQQAVSGINAMGQDVQNLDKGIKIESQVKQAESMVDQSLKSNEKITLENVKDEAQAKAKYEDLGKVGGKTDSDKEPEKVPAVQNKSATVQRDETTTKKPSAFSRFKGWLARKFGSIKKRVKRAFLQVKAKLTEIALKVVGVKKIQAMFDEGVKEKRAEAGRVMEAIDQSDAEANQYTAVASQLGGKVKSGSKSK